MWVLKSDNWGERAGHCTANISMHIVTLKYLKCGELSDRAENSPLVHWAWQQWPPIMGYLPFTCQATATTPLLWRYPMYCIHTFSFKKKSMWEMLNTQCGRCSTLNAGEGKTQYGRSFTRKFGINMKSFSCNWGNHMKKNCPICVMFSCISLWYWWNVLCAQ